MAQPDAVVYRKGSDMEFLTNHLNPHGFPVWLLLAMAPVGAVGFYVKEKVRNRWKGGDR